MKIVLDECMPKLLKRDLAGHEVFTVGEMGWAGTKNGKLLDAAEAVGFHVLLTVDQNMEYQQNLQGRQIALVVMLAPNKLPKLRPMVPPIVPMLLKALDVIKPSDVVHIEP